MASASFNPTEITDLPEKYGWNVEQCLVYVWQMLSEGQFEHEYPYSTFAISNSGKRLRIELSALAEGQQSSTLVEKADGALREVVKLAREICNLAHYGWLNPPKDLEYIFTEIEKRGLALRALAAQDSDTPQRGDNHGYRINNAIGLAKSAIGDCVDKIPYVDIHGKLWDLVRMLYEINDAIAMHEQRQAGRKDAAQTQEGRDAE